jgi:hypothetical protein
MAIQHAVAADRAARASWNVVAFWHQGLCCLKARQLNRRTLGGILVTKSSTVERCTRILGSQR